MLKTRLLTALALVLLFAATAVLGRVYFIFLMLGFFAIASWELAGLLGIKQLFLFSTASLVGLVFVLVSAPPIGYVAAVALALWLFLLFPLLFLPRAKLSNTWHGSAYLACLIVAFDCLISFFDQSPLTLIAVLAIAWCADTGAYFAGRTLGRHKLAPTISAGKTWEGVAGGIVAVVLLVYGLNAFPATHAELPPFMSATFSTWPSIILLCIGLSALCVMGDLFESLLKRRAGVKDSGRTLPGHGGVLDRMDAWLPLLAAATTLDYFF